MKRCRTRSGKWWAHGGIGSLNIRSGAEILENGTHRDDHQIATTIPRVLSRTVEAWVHCSKFATDLHQRPLILHVLVKYLTPPGIQPNSRSLHPGHSAHNLLHLQPIITSGATWTEFFIRTNRCKQLQPHPSSYFSCQR